MKSRILRIVTLVFISLWTGAWAYAHPHNWIALNSRFVLDDNARLVQIGQRWEFDMYYSLMTHADLLNEFGDEEKGLLETAKRMVGNLKDFNYFSKLKFNGSTIDLGTPDQYQLNIRQQDGELVLELEMTFDIDANTSIEDKTLAWQVYDPTYYIAMNHETAANIEIVGGNATECTKSLEFAEPTDEQIEYAASLDRTQRDTAGLGEIFAETALIRCI